MKLKSEIINIIVDGEQHKLEFVERPLHMRQSKAGKNDVIASLWAVLGDESEISLSYFRYGNLLVSRYRYYPVATNMTVHLARPTEEGKRRAVAYILKAMSEVLQDEDVNEEMDI